MPSVAPPAREHDYLASLLTTTSQVRGVFVDIGERLRALEAFATDIEADSANIVQQSIAAAQEQLTQIVEETRAAFGAIDVDLALAEDRLLAIQQGGVEALKVAVSPIEGLDATNAQAALGELMSTVAALALGLNESLAELTQSLNAAIANEAQARQEADAQILSNSSGGGIVSAMIWS